jgi:hypothetical protein
MKQQAINSQLFMPKVATCEGCDCGKKKECCKKYKKKGVHCKKCPKV